MSYEIDLRSQDYLRRELFLKKKTLFKVILVIFLFSPLFFYGGLNYYHRLLENQATVLENEVNMLRLAAEPLLSISSELENVETRKEVIEELKFEQKKWSVGVHMLYDKAPAQITITGIEITTDGSIKIDGVSSNLHAPARYRQNLASLPHFEQTELDIMTLNSEHYYTFKITTRLLTGDELDDNTEKIAAQ